jgi:hypothetical protein
MIFAVGLGVFCWGLYIGWQARAIWCEHHED